MAERDKIVKESSVPSTRSPLKVRIDQLAPNPHQPRRYFDEEELRILSETMAQGGQLEPVWCIRGSTEDIPSDIKISADKFLIINGERRWRAAKQAGLEEMDVEVLEKSYVEAYRDAVVAHVTNKEWNPIEEARAILASTLDRFGGEDWFKEFGEGVEAVAKCAEHILAFRRGRTMRLKMPEEAAQAFEAWITAGTGHKLTQVREWVERSKIPPNLEERVARGHLAVSAAQILAAHQDEKEQEAMAERAIRTSLNVNEVRKLAHLIGNEKIPEEVKESLLEGEASPEILMGKKEDDLEVLGRALKEAKRIAEKEDVSTQEALSLLGDKSKEFRDLKRQALYSAPRVSVRKLKKPDVLDRLVDLVAERAVEAGQFQGLDEYDRMEQATSLVQSAGSVIRRIIERDVRNQGEQIIKLIYPDPDQLYKRIQSDLAMRW